MKKKEVYTAERPFKVASINCRSLLGGREMLATGPAVDGAVVVTSGALGAIVEDRFYIYDGEFNKMIVLTCGEEMLGAVALSPGYYRALDEHLYTILGVVLPELAQELKGQALEAPRVLKRFKARYFAEALERGIDLMSSGDNYTRAQINHLKAIGVLSSGN